MLLLFQPFEAVPRDHLLIRSSQARGRPGQQQRVVERRLLGGIVPFEQDRAWKVILPIVVRGTMLDSGVMDEYWNIPLACSTLRPLPHGPDR